MAFIFAMANQGNHSYLFVVLCFWLCHVLVEASYLNLSYEGKRSQFKCLMEAVFCWQDLMCYATFAAIIYL